MRKKPNKPEKVPENRSKEGAADLEAKKSIRGDAQKAKLRTRQHESSGRIAAVRKGRRTRISAQVLGHSRSSCATRPSRVA
jgi:hypothetical protein